MDLQPASRGNRNKLPYFGRKDLSQTRGRKRAVRISSCKIKTLMIGLGGKMDQGHILITLNCPNNY